jgi:hypothetical protein
MINFTCKCGHQFSMTEDTAGGSIQCPDCKLLVDIPYLSDLQNLAEDGTFQLSPELQRDEQAIEDLARTAGRKQTDEDGETYDLRPTPEDIMNAGVEEIPLELKDEVRPGAPKYDPETGELIRPMDLKPNDEPSAADIPVAKPALNYASGMRLEDVPPAHVPLALLRPANLIVLIVVFLFHMLNQVFVVAIAGGMVFVVVLPVLMVFIIFGHYANVIDEVGRQDRDELPGLLRGVSWGEDIWHPFVAFAGAAMLCYLPALWVRDIAAPLGPIMVLVLAGLGTLLFPAVLLTTATSGSVFNLRPDRVISVIRCCGSAYTGTVLMWAVAAGLYGVGLYGVSAQAAAMVKWGQPQLPIAPLVAYPVLLAAIYMMHLFVWHLGLLYRQHQPQFPWVLQQHNWSMKDEKELQALRRQRARRVRKAPAVAASPRVAQPAARQPGTSASVKPITLKAVPVQPSPVKPIPVEPIPLEPIPLDEPMPAQPTKPIPVQPLESAQAEAPADAKNRLARAQAHLLKAMKQAEERQSNVPFRKGNQPPTAAGYC